MLTKITEFVKPIGDWIRRSWHDLFVLSCVALISFISYTLGRVQALEKTPLRIEQGANIYTAGEEKVSTTDILSGQGSGQSRTDRRVVASKNSNLYHFTWCSGAKRIKESNKIWFQDEATAQKAGYTLAGNCQ